MTAKSLMVLGTASGVGKSVIAAGLCRLLSDWGYRVAPFKAQNMSNNSFVTEEGGEMGRAQVVQAECARLAPHVDMNPVLLKPAQDNGSQVILQGKALGHLSARDYYAQKTLVMAAVRESYERLASSYEVLVLEGAGSPAEVNLRDHDFVNMKMAEMADASCLLVGDIDRGGIFAALIGTLDLLEPSERERVKGLLINKFRGDPALLGDGLDFLERRTGKKVWGVIPYDPELQIDEEDAATLLSPSPFPSPRMRGEGVCEFPSPQGGEGVCEFPSPQGGEGVCEFPSPQGGEGRVRGVLDIAVIRFPRISNFTDFQPLAREPGVRLRYVEHAAELGSPDLLILPGTKSTITDFCYLAANGFREKILEFAEGGGRVLGVCGGYQMMGKVMRDKEGVETARPTEVRGLGLLNIMTDFAPEKILRQVDVCLELKLFGRRVAGRVQGYEIHMGRTVLLEAYPTFGEGGAIHPSGRLAGTYLHGLFENAEFRRSFLDALRKKAGTKKAPTVPVPIKVPIKEIHYARLASLIARHLDLNLLRECLSLPLPSY